MERTSSALQSRGSLVSAKQKAIRIADELGVEIEVEYHILGWESPNRIERIMLYAPDGYNWEGDRHLSGAVTRRYDNYYMPAPELWEGVIKELEIPLEKCPEDCVCKE